MGVGWGGRKKTEYYLKRFVLLLSLHGKFKKWLFAAILIKKWGYFPTPRFWLGSVTALVNRMWWKWYHVYPEPRLQVALKLSFLPFGNDAVIWVSLSHPNEEVTWRRIEMSVKKAHKLQPSAKTIPIADPQNYEKVNYYCFTSLYFGVVYCSVQSPQCCLVLLTSYW